MDQNSISNALQAGNRYDCFHVAAAEKVGIKEGGQLRWQEDSRYTTTGIFPDDRFKPKELAVPVQESDFFKVYCVYKATRQRALFLSCAVRSILSCLPSCITAVLHLLVIYTIVNYFISLTVFLWLSLWGRFRRILWTVVCIYVYATGATGLLLPLHICHRR